ncbi:hypothetical protein SteCoe_26342 [Stentor coeruleus]|uniref:Major facilitator superfamily (MFS) profile domain-containing protein n=1 Tax=Stentor coeruleus TaxID=5963 RepID=A0A1R2BD56_9CILI|nr:hypothetical protein SteCoe_26342 [Stentor coeruleus]
MARLLLDEFSLNPLQHLLLYISIGCIINLDQASFAALLPVMKSPIPIGLSLSNSDLGIIGSFSMLFSTIFSPISVYFSQTKNSHHILFLTLLIWSSGVLLTSFSQGFWTLFLSRSVTSIGICPLVPLSYACLLEITPEPQKNLRISIFTYNQIIGSVIGVIYGPLLMYLLGSWRYSFALEILFISPLLFILHKAKENPKLVFPSDEGQKSGLLTQIKTLFGNSVYVGMVSTFAAMSFVNVGFAYWVIYNQTIDYLQNYFKIDPSTGNIAFAFIQLVTGVIGIGLGPVILNFMLRSLAEDLEKKIIDETRFDNFRVSKATFLCFLLSIGIFTFGLFGALSNNVIFFLIGLSLCFFFTSLASGPATIAMLFAVPKNLKGQSGALACIFSCVFGNFLAPFAIGIFFDWAGYYWGMVFNASWSFLGLVSIFLTFNIGVIFI